MTAAVDRFVKYLVMECEEEEGTTFVDELRALAKAEILAGKGSVGFLTTASANGKNVAQAEKLSCDEVASACLTAKRLYNDDAGSSPITFADFSSMNL